MYGIETLGLTPVESEIANAALSEIYEDYEDVDVPYRLFYHDTKHTLA